MSCHLVKLDGQHHLVQQIGRKSIRYRNRTSLTYILVAALAIHTTTALVPYRKYINHVRSSPYKPCHNFSPKSLVCTNMVSIALEDVGDPLNLENDDIMLGEKSILRDVVDNHVDNQIYSPNEVYAPGSQALNENVTTDGLLTGAALANGANMLEMAVSAVEVPNFKELTVKSEKSSISAALTDVRMFTLPLLGVWLSNPLLSLIDTTAVGKFSGVSHLAALSPATCLCDDGIYMLSFLTIVTTNQLANAFKKNDMAAVSKHVEDGLLASAAVGLAFSLVLLSPLGTTALECIVPQTVKNLIPLSLGYMHIRAFGFIPALAALVLQASSLARRAVSLPLVAVALSSILNISGDVLLVGVLGMGINGAAVATVAAQILSCAILLKYELRELRLSNRRIRQRIKDASKFLGLCLGPAFALVGKSTVNLSLTQTAGICGTASLAAHQVCIGIYYLLCPMGDAISQTVQNLLPGTMGDQSRMEDSGRTNIDILTKDGRSLMCILAGAAMALGVFDAAVGGSLTLFFPSFFSSVPEVIAEMIVVAPLVGGCLLLHALGTTLEGALFATRDTSFLSIAYPLLSVVACTAFAMLRDAARLGKSAASLKAVWTVLFFYQVTRCTQFVARFAWNQRKSMNSSNPQPQYI